MVHILDTLARLETKFDSLSMANEAALTPENNAVIRKLTQHSPAESSQKSDKTPRDHIQDFPRELQQSYHHLTVPHKIILWPSIYIHLINSGISATADLQYVLQEGTAWFIRQEIAMHPTTLPYDISLPYFAINSGMREQGYACNVAFPTLSIQQIQEFCDAYFNTFNILFPILDREAFMNGTVAPLLRDGYGDGDPKAVLALLVFALGKVAIEAVFERPISLVDGQPSGFRGGTVDKPPGLAIFNEARRRMGFVATLNSLENVQMLLLEALYYESDARHLDFWRATSAASLACQMLIKCKAVDWDSPTGDLVKRAYWTCILSEDFYHLVRTPKQLLHLHVPVANIFGWRTH